MGQNMNQRGYVANANDSVGTAIGSIETGRILLSSACAKFEIHALSRIPFGHKFAVKMITSGSPIFIYRKQIGTATADITIGERVHILSMRNKYLSWTRSSAANMSANVLRNISVRRVMTLILQVRWPAWTFRLLSGG